MTNETMIMRNGNNFVFDRKPPKSSLDQLPPAVYELNVDPDGNPFVTEVAQSYVVPSKLYGDINETKERIYKTYTQKQGKPFGVMLVGLKGTGKTQLAELLCNEAISNGVPIITLTKEIPVDLIRKALTLLKPCVFYVDELDKVYNSGFGSTHELDKFASLIGSSSTDDVMSIITTNERKNLPNVFLDRPTRFYYRIIYSSMEETTIKEFLVDHGLDIGWYDALVPVRRNLTYDLLNTYVELFKEFKTIEEFNKYKHLYNIPEPERLSTNIRYIRYAEEADVSHHRDTTSKLTIRVSTKDEGVVQYTLDANDVVNENPNMDSCELVSEDGKLVVGLDITNGFQPSSEATIYTNSVDVTQGGSTGNHTVVKNLLPKVKSHKKDSFSISHL